MLAVLTQSYQTRRQPLEQQLEALKEKRGNQESTLMAISQDVYGTPHLQNKHSLWPTIILVIALLMVGFSEWPLNSAAFETFELSQNLTYWIAFAFGMVMAILAHLSGYTLKRSIAAKQTYMAVLAFVLIIGSILALYILSGLRFTYLTEMSGHDALSPVLQTIVTGIIFFVGVTASFLHTSSARNTEAEKSYKAKYAEYEKTQNQITELESKISILDDEHSRKLEDESKVWEEQERMVQRRSSLIENAEIVPITKEKEPKIDIENKDTPEKETYFRSDLSIEHFKKSCMHVENWLQKYQEVEEGQKILAMQPHFIEVEIGNTRKWLRRVKESLLKESNPDAGEIYGTLEEQYLELVKRIKDEIPA